MTLVYSLLNEMFTMTNTFKILTNLYIKNKHNKKPSYIVYGGLNVECEIKNKHSMNSVILLYYDLRLSEIHESPNVE